MGLKPETMFRMRVRDRLKTIQHSWFESIQQKAIQGTPDIMGCVNGVFVAIELKATPMSKPTEMQRLKLARIAEAGGIGLIVHPGNLENTLILLNEIARGNNAETKLEGIERSEPSFRVAEAVESGKD